MGRILTMPDFTSSTIPDDEPAPEWLDKAETPDLSCESCGTPLVYQGRGRKPRFCAEHKPSAPKRASVPRGSSSDVASAMHTLGGLYDALAMGLMLVSPDAATVWASQVENLQVKNAIILAADKDLCKMINRGAAKGGRYAFFAAHAMAITPPLMIAVQQRRQTIAAQRVQDQKDAEDPGLLYVDPTAF